MRVSLALKGDVPICRNAVAVIRPPDEPLYYIPQEEEDDEHLHLLSCVYRLMLHSDSVYISALAHKDKRPQSQCREPFEWNKGIIYYYHNGIKF